MADEIKVDKKGFVYVCGVKVAQCLATGSGPVLRFHDRCKGRSERRGTPYVDASLDDLASAIGNESPLTDDT